MTEKTEVANGALPMLTEEFISSVKDELFPQLIADMKRTKSTGTPAIRVEIILSADESGKVTVVSQDVSGGIVKEK